MLVAGTAGILCFLAASPRAAGHTPVQILEVVCFKRGSAELEASHERTLGTLAGALRVMPRLRVEVQGRANDAGSARGNQRLSERRGHLVTKRLLDGGVAAGSLRTGVYGASRATRSRCVTFETLNAPYPIVMRPPFRYRADYPGPGPELRLLDEAHRLIPPLRTIRTLPAVGEVEPSIEDRLSKEAGLVQDAWGDRVRRRCWLDHLRPHGAGGTQCSLRLDIDGDGRIDWAVLVEEAAGGRSRKGIGLFLGSGETFLFGAGATFGNGGDDFDWLDAWRVVPRKQTDRTWRAQGEVLLVEKSESASGLIGWISGRPVWRQGAD